MTDSQDILTELSALLDGELPADRRAFLLRRLENDQALKATWERWQFASTCLRQGGIVPAAPGFASGVADRIAAEAAPRRPIAGTLARWAGGGAIAAAVAVFALVAISPQESTPGDVATRTAQTSVQVAPSPLIESDLQPRFQSPAQTVAANQRLPLLQMQVSEGGLDPRAQAYLVRHQTALRQAGLVEFAPYVDVLAHPEYRSRPFVNEPVASEEGAR